MLETLRERLLSVQQDFTSGLKTLSDKSREAKVKNKPRTVPCLPKYSAGLELLSRYEDTWAALHRRAKECASAGERVDSEVVMLSAHWEKKQASLRDLQRQLQQLPGLIADLESLTASLTHLEASFEEVENHLLNLEDLCGQCELERHKHTQSQQLENYKKNKRKELETFKEKLDSSKTKLQHHERRAELDAEHSQKVLEMEQTQQLKLKERQKFFEEAFQQDMEQYLSTGYLQIAERREPMGSMSSMEVNVDMLEQMDLMDISDQEALDVFLNSGGEENTLLSPISGTEKFRPLDSLQVQTLVVASNAEIKDFHDRLSSALSPGPEASPGQDAVTLQVPTPSQSPATPPSSSSPGTDPASRDPSEGGESPVVQSDEEGVEVDTALAALHSDDGDS